MEFNSYLDPAIQLTRTFKEPILKNDNVYPQMKYVSPAGSFYN